MINDQFIVSLTLTLILAYLVIKLIDLIFNHKHKTLLRTIFFQQALYEKITRHMRNKTR
jgi:hypothetical protein